MTDLTQSTLATLDLAYRGTLYEVFREEGAIQIRVGIQNPALDRLLQQYQKTTWAFVTAYNPHSRLLRADENCSRNQVLLANLKQLGLPLFNAVGRDESGQWPPEESFFVMGIDRRDAIQMGREFSQNAILYGEMGNSPELLTLVRQEGEFDGEQR